MLPCVFCEGILIMQLSTMPNTVAKLLSGLAQRGIMGKRREEEMCHNGAKGWGCWEERLNRGCVWERVNWFCSHHYFGSLGTQSRGNLQVLTPSSGTVMARAGGYVDVASQCSWKSEKLKSGTMVWSTKGIDFLSAQSLKHVHEKMFTSNLAGELWCHIDLQKTNKQKDFIF